MHCSTHHKTQDVKLSELICENNLVISVNKLVRNVSEISDAMMNGQPHYK